ncbi:hypothetical protein [Lacticaseibacillus saniviri]|uniref:hypothetical protein n=1 Tax=Lacticaseibacillus saniviri TaxID=931533 RepID=UPI001EDE02D9|nr:hypothetical protein [Lacticaseibacillus saniviri]
MKAFLSKKDLKQLHKEFVETDKKISNAQSQSQLTVNSFSMDLPLDLSKTGLRKPKRQLKVHGDRSNLK